MKLRFDLTVDELIMGMRVLFKTSPYVKAQLRRKQMVLLFVYVLLAFGFYFLTGDTVFPGMLFSFILFVVLLLPKLTSHQSARAYRSFYKNEQLARLQNLTIDLNEKRIRSSSKSLANEYAWEEVKALFEYPHYYFIPLKTEQILIIPKTALPKKADQKAFKQYFKAVPFVQHL